MLNKNDHEKMERSATTELPSHVDVNMPVMSCASMHDSHHWPDFISMEENYQPVYNCLQYELSDGAHMVMSADAKGMHAIVDFCLAIKTRLVDKPGGIHPGTSQFEFPMVSSDDCSSGQSPHDHQ